MNEGEPYLVVLAGDLTDDGCPDQYPLAARELARLEPNARSLVETITAQLVAKLVHGPTVELRERSWVVAR